MTANTVYYLFGHAGVGKLTIAREIAAITGAKVVDNHYVNNPVFNLIELYRPTPLPQAVWDRVAEIRHAVLETIATLSPPDWSFVFTNVLLDDDSSDVETYRVVRETAMRRRATFQPIRLVCDVEELCRRIAMPERRSGLKDTSPENARIDVRRPLMTLDDPGLLELDVTTLPPDEAARIIVAAAADRPRLKDHGA